MANVKQYSFDLLEAGEFFLRKEGIKDGFWTIGVNFGLAPLQGGPDKENVRPAMLVVVENLLLTRADGPGPLTIDASGLK